MKNKRPYIFLMVGAINSLLDFCFYTFLTQVVFKNQELIGVVGVVSGTFALICALTSHSLITWRDAGITRTTIIKFISITGFGMWVIRPLLLGVFINFAGLYEWVYGLSQAIHMPFSQSFITNTGAFGLMIVVLLIYNYLTYDRLVFKPGKAQ